MIIIRPSESVKNYTSHLRESTNFAVREIKKVCKDVGPRPPASEAESKGQDFYAETMKKFSDKVETEEFRLSPGGFMGWVGVCAVILIIAVAFSALDFFNTMPQFSLVFRIIPLVLSVLAALFIIFEFLLYREILDPFFKKGASKNVMCTYKPSGEVKRRIIFCGHMDSAHEWRYSYLGGPKLLKFVIIPAVIFAGIDFLTYVAALINDNHTVNLIMMIVRFVSIIWFFLGMFFVNWNVAAPGATDNLSGVYTAAGVLQFLSANGIRFGETEVVAMSSGCAEAGLRGAKAYAAAHAGELNEVDTIFIALDSIHDPDCFGINSGEMSGTVKLDTGVCSLLAAAAELAGVKRVKSEIRFGATDAAATMQAGIRSASIVAINSATDPIYHTRKDMPEALNFEVVESCLSVCLEAVFLFDEKGTV